MGCGLCFLWAGATKGWACTIGVQEGMLCPTIAVGYGCQHNCYACLGELAAAGMPHRTNLDYANRSRTFILLGIAIRHKSKKSHSGVLHSTGPDVAQTVNTTGYVLLRARGPVRVT